MFHYKEMTRITKMKRKINEEASEFVSIDLKSTRMETKAIQGRVGEQGKNKRIRHRPKPETQIEPTKKEKEALRRKNRRLKLKEKTTVCFLCRSKGHSIQNCPQNIQKESELIEMTEIGSICYRCGSLEHVLAKCDQKKDKKNSLPFSTCFVCKQKGHLAGQCPENSKGVYPNGGSCKFCGSVRHLANECKPLESKDVITLGTITIDQGGDDDDVFNSIKKISQEKPLLSIKKKKVVNF
jgi:zinc finger CCHC domain-containing protein 9